ncbi:N-formylglutamate amidohydrolase [Rufibacter aurantiacus]|uniref:N-formylglutamate amidohydrolase n=1 Tax=Rufibacter aurantiacus TaxID=2817374 RepID=UPI001B30C2DB|nr:N-formylglutamate amidohydrolase [Rufibacter aurantiacus]
MKNERLKVIVTCEHAGNEIPPEFAAAFEGAKQVLATHRGYDIGALELYQKFSKIADFSLYSTTSRLVVELNRSLHHPKLFSEFMLPLSTAEAEKVVADYYQPYRQRVEEQIASWVREDFSVIHVSVHSFTPELNGKERKADIGLLYDPKREKEQLFAARWRQQMQMVNTEIKIRYNYPYKGTADGFITHLRKDYTDTQYAGLELEVNQRFPEAHKEEWKVLQSQLIQTFNLAL